MALHPKRAAEKTILIVEDDTYISEVLVLVISQETPYQALFVPDAFQALVTINDIKPDLFLLDYHLPRMNGIELYDLLHTTEGLEHVRTIMISTNVPQQEIRQLEIVSIRKPFALNNLPIPIRTVLA